MSTTTEYKTAKAEAKAQQAFAKAQRPWYSKKRYWALGGIVGIVAISAMASGGGSESSTATASDSSASAKAGSESAAPAADLAVDAGTLISDFEKNELAADQTYADKTLKVTGVVDKIDTDILNADEYVLNLTDGGRFEILSVSVYGMSEADLAKVEPGETVTVIAEFDDGGDLGVEMNDGRLA